QWILSFIGLIWIYKRRIELYDNNKLLMIYFIAIIFIPITFFSSSTPRYYLYSSIFLYFSTLSYIYIILRIFPIIKLVDLITIDKNKYHQMGLIFMVIGILPVLFGISVDWFGFSQPGIGPNQIALIYMGLFLIFIGMLTLIFVGIFKINLNPYISIILFIMISINLLNSANISLQKVSLNKIDERYNLEKEIGARVKKVSKSNDVVMMNSPLVINYFSHLPAVNPPRNSRYIKNKYVDANQLNKVIDYYDLTIFVDYGNRDLYDLIPDRLHIIDIIDFNRIGYNSYPYPVTIYRILNG
ncbi:uncharacterized protein METZ01_LOCUS362526, partial [marine metagenome]